MGVLMCVFSETQNYAIQARLNFILGAKNYDAYFLGIQCAAMSESLVVVYVQSEFTAHAITERYSTTIAVAVESVIQEPVSKVTVLAGQNQAR
ncbi:DnaA N-terminal domain-containing protein [Bradyrhizobium sp. 2TAF36]|uniref:DnaA N-terminal domain-containing protein n=1 Tax=Bradyrhizobium sp. 2TAF36 TaxID=3233016 RepID=UPI003F93DFEF